jgi:hypothetical protein
MHAGDRQGGTHGSDIRLTISAFPLVVDGWDMVVLAVNPKQSIDAFGIRGIEWRLEDRLRELGTHHPPSATQQCCNVPGSSAR